MGEKWYQGERFEKLMRRSAGVLLLVAMVVLLFGACALGLTCGAAMYMLLVPVAPTAAWWMGLLVGINAFGAGYVGRQHIVTWLAMDVLKVFKVDNQDEP